MQRNPTVALSLVRVSMTQSRSDSNTVAPRIMNAIPPRPQPEPSSKTVFPTSFSGENFLKLNSMYFENIACIYNVNIVVVILIHRRGPYRSLPHDGPMA